MMRGARLFSKLRGPGLSVFDQGLVSVANFFSILLLARAMPAGEFGVLMVAYTGLLVLVSLQQAFVIYPHSYIGAPLGNREFAQFTSMLALMQLLASSVACLLLALVGAIVAASGFAYYGAVIAVLGAVGFPWLLQEFIRRAFYARSHVREAAFNDFVSYGLQLAGVIWLTWRGEPSPINVLLVYGGSSLVAVIFGIFQLRGWLDFSGEDSLIVRFKETTARVWNFGKWLVGGTMVTWFGMTGDMWLIAGILGTEAAGIYRAVIHVAGVLNPLRNAASAYLPARASLALHHGGRPNLAGWVRRTAMVCYSAVLPIALAFIVAPGPILQLAYGTKFSGYELLLTLSTVAMIIEFAGFPLGVAILAMLSSRAMFKVHLIPVAMLPTVGVLMIWMFGIFGAPLFHIIAACATLTATLWIYRKYIGRDEGLVGPPEWQPSR